MASKATVLLVEDHQELAATVGAFLESKDFVVDYASDGNMALSLVAETTFDAIVLDIMLPGIDGIEVCRRLRKEERLTTPILMLTARDQLDDKLLGFDVGCDDYLVKPFDMPELVARIEALIRRERGLSARYEVGPIELDVDTLTVTRDGAALKLSRTGFDILKILMREAPKVVTRETIERELWGEDVPDSDALRSHLYNLRQVVDKPFDAQLIETLPGRGYRLLEK
ncbi:MAG: response regulator transcription factor [Pseudomonadota bacterium]